MRRTWAPKGQTPVLVTPFNWKRLSVIAGLMTTASTRRVGLCLRLHPGSIQQPQIIDYLRALKRHVRGRRTILLWDRLPVHRGAQVQAYLKSQARWLTAEYLPPYAPELNPVEYLWSHMKGTVLANFTAPNLYAVRRKARQAACRVRHQPDLGKGFLKHSGLFP